MVLIKILQNFVNQLENIQLSFGHWLASLLSIIFIRSFLEIFSDINNYGRVLNFQRFFVHYPICIIAVLFLIILVLRFMSQERIEKITKISILFSLIIWSVPVLDLILSLGKGFNISYLQGDFKSLMSQFITFFGPYVGKGASYGMRIEISIVLFLTFLYVYLKTGHIVKSVITPFIIYLIIFTLGSIPAWLMIIMEGLNDPTAASRFLEIEKILNHFYSFDLKISMIILILIFLELILWLYFYDKNKFRSLLKNVRVARVVHYETMLGMGMGLGFLALNDVNPLSSPLSYLIILISLFSVFFAWLCAIGINDLSDVKIDNISNRERPLVGNKISQYEFKSLTWVFFLLALLFGYLVRYSFMVLIIVYIVLAHIYSTKPFRFKKIPILSSFVIASASLIIMMSGYLIFAQDQGLIQFPRPVIVLVLLVFTLAVNFKDIKDIDGDKQDGIVTLLTLFGKRNGKKIIGGLVLFSYLLVPLILSIPRLIVFSVICGSVSFFIINRNKMNERIFFGIYFLFVGFVIYFYYIEA